MLKKETIIVCSAHSDDFVIGAGGTIAKYAKEGKKVIAVVFSYGELSHPWLKGHVVRSMRSKESYEAGRVLNCKVLLFKLREGKFLEDYQKRGMEEKFNSILKRAKPTKIFTHSNEDPHPDHKAVHHITLQAYETMQKKPDVYIYSVWNPVSLKTHYPALYVNIFETFSTKLAALKTFHSQKVHVAYPLVLLILRSVLAGLKLGTLFGEKFFKIR
ncbi:MAG: PIG-L deacetylase family protein [Nanoarchaeota archaeon]